MFGDIKVPFNSAMLYNVAKLKEGITISDVEEHLGTMCNIVKNKYKIMSNSGIGQFIPLILIFVIFYFFLIRPQQKKAKEHKTMVENLKRGDKVITSGGIVGKVDRIIDNEKVEVEIADNVKVEVVRATGIQALLTTQEVKK